MVNPSFVPETFVLGTSLNSFHEYQFDSLVLYVATNTTLNVQKSPEQGHLSPICEDLIYTQEIGICIPGYSPPDSKSTRPSDGLDTANGIHHYGKLRIRNRPDEIFKYILFCFK